VVSVDAAQIERVFANVLENALRYSPRGEPVELSAELRDRDVVIRVDDNGPGIPERERERVFEAFSHGRKGGSGLGLAIARGFAEANGGRIWVEPAERGGTSVLFAVPAARVPAGLR
jgi:two-component system sensor histidine kinase KdpD